MNCETCGVSFKAARSDARFCSDRCRKRAARGKARKRPPSPRAAEHAGDIPIYDSNEDAIADLVDELRDSGQLAGHESLGTLAINLARQVDREPGHSGLWGQLRDAEEQLRRLRPDPEDSVIEALLEEMRSAVPDESDMGIHREESG